MGHFFKSARYQDVPPELKTGGDFDGWFYWPSESFEAKTAGPFFSKKEQDGYVSAFRAEEKHMNSGGVVHGGCLMTFADFSLFTIAHDHMNDENTYGLTVAFTSEFLSGAKLGHLIEARGDVLRAGRSIIFVRGVVTSNDVPCLNFSGTIKKVTQS